MLLLNTRVCYVIGFYSMEQKANTVKKVGMLERRKNGKGQPPGSKYDQIGSREYIPLFDVS
jgi:hypothetical protein